MKKIVMSVFFLLLGLIILAQPTGSDTLQLSVRGGPNDRTLEFKPGKRLKLTTTTGEIILSRKYAITADYVLTEKYQLIYYQDIVRIKGRIMNDSGRVLLGILVTGTGMFLLGKTLAIATLVLTPHGTLLLTAIETGVIVGGVRLMGHRTFRIKKGWEIQTYLAGD